MDKLDILRQFAFFREASPAFQAEIAAAAGVVRLNPGDFFLREGEPCRQFALVGSGRLRVFKSAESGREITLYMVGPGECCLLNASCITSGAPIPATAQAETAMEVALIPGELFREWLGRDAALRATVFDLLATHLARIMALVEEVAFKRMDRRLAEYLLAAPSEGAGSAPAILATHEQIAVHLGSAREVVSRLLKEFERMGGVRLGRGRVEVANREVLRAVAAPD